MEKSSLLVDLMIQFFGHSNLYSVLHMDIRDAEKIVGKKVKIISSGNNAFIGVVHSFDSESRSFVLISDCHHSRGSICVQIVYGYNIESLEILNHVLTSHSAFLKKLQLLQDSLNFLCVVENLFYWLASGFISMIELSLDDISNIIGKKVKLVAEENHTYTGIVQSVDPITFSFVLVDQSDVSNEHMKVYLVNGRAIVSMEISPDELSEDEKKIYEDFLNAFSFVYCKCQTIKKQPIMSIAEEHLADIFIAYCKLHLLEYCFNELELIISQHAGKKNLVTFYIETKLVHDIVWRKPNLAILYFRKALDSILMQMAKTKVAKEAVHFRLMAHQSNAPFHRQKSEMDSLLGCLITLKGAITKVSQLRLIQTRKEMKCRRCGYKFFYDASFDQCYRLTNPKSCPSPVGCGSTKFEDIITAGSPPITFCRRYQEVKLHDVNNLSNSGPLSESVVVALEEELVDSCRLGEVVLITGILCRRCQPLKKLQEPRFQIVLRATHVASAPKSQNLELAHDAIEEFKEFWSNYKQTPIVGRNVILSNFCPGMYQMYLVKLAVLLVIIGGVSRRSESGTMLRGDCHLLLIGDPGTGKSQFLKYAAKLASNSVYTTGIGTTNAGLTCSAVKEEGDWQLEAGALPLADGGICCIDEFSTMRETEKDAIREAMEQQTVSVAKAGLVTKLNCKCSIIAACNFKETVGSRSATVDCNLSSPLMSRFDVILYLRQSSDKEWCPKICAHLLYEQLASASASFRQSSVDSNPSASSLFWTFDKIKTYIKVVKSIEPSISEGAEKLVYLGIVLTQYFMKQRSNVNREEGLTTVRMLDSLIRLAQAHARLMFRDVVTVQDALIATIFIELTLKDLSLLVTPDPLQSVFPSDPEADYKQFEMLMLEVLGLDGQLNGADSRGDCSIKISTLKDDSKQSFKFEQCNYSEVVSDVKRENCDSVESNQLQSCSSTNPANVAFDWGKTQSSGKISGEQLQHDSMISFDDNSDASSINWTETESQFAKKDDNNSYNLNSILEKGKRDEEFKTILNQFKFSDE
ncbi:DNA helicase MCM9 [Trichinella pseudospiralis]|uniref:DNA helicase n=1 Tax=Trichinella pseudospiralis TaxID=6337 RepID=A0A0V1F0R6_TRIPS|nr:DNA helicase MCM9 [Trichinella pseudospiralis]